MTKKMVWIVPLLLIAGLTLTGCQQAPAPRAGRPSVPAPVAGAPDLTQPGKPIAQVGVGDAVWAKYADGFHYVATVTAVSGETYSVDYADGYKGDVPKADLAPFGISVDMVVQCKWSKGGFWPAKVLTVSPGAVEVEFLDDKSRESHTAADLRLKPSPAINLSNTGKSIARVGAGDAVWAKWTDGYYYIGTVAEVNGETYSIRFADGDKGQMAQGDLRQFSITKGMLLQSKWSKGGYWPAKVVAVSPEAAVVEFLDDKTREPHSAADLRLKP
jgi:hypothetical protein